MKPIKWGLLLYLLLLLILGFNTHYKGEFISRGNAQVVVLSKPYNEFPRINVYESTTGIAFSMGLTPDIHTFIDVGDRLNTSKETYRKWGKLEDRYTLITLDTDGTPIYDLTTAKNVVTTNVFVDVLGTEEVRHTVSNGKFDSHYYTYEVTYRDQNSSKPFTQSIPQEVYCTLKKDSKVMAIKRDYTLRNNKVVHRYSLVY